MKKLKNHRHIFFFKKQIQKSNSLSKHPVSKDIHENNGILYYSGRILPTEKIQAASEMAEVIKDVSSSAFCVPLVYKHSPLAYSLINKLHQHTATAKYSGTETACKCVLKTAYIIFGRDLIINIKVQCERCRYVKKDH